MTARFGLGTGVSHGRNSRTNGLVRESSMGLTIEVNNFNVKIGDMIHTKLSTIRFSFLFFIPPPTHTPRMVQSLMIGPGCSQRVC